MRYLKQNSNCYTYLVNLETNKTIGKLINKESNTYRNFDKQGIYVGKQKHILSTDYYL